MSALARPPRSAPGAGGLRLLLVSVVGLALFGWPFSGHDLPGDTAALAVALAVVVALLFVEGALDRLDARRFALLVTLVAIDTALRMTLVTGIGGFSPIFLLILSAGFVFGPSFGFLNGALTLLVSALATGGVGPWLPYQVFAAGWVGLGAGLAGWPARGLSPRSRVLLLALVGAAMGYLYGVAMDVWDWTFFRGQPDFGWTPGLAAGPAVSRFLHYYVATSLTYDSFRAAGNVVMVLALGVPVVTSLTRLRSRFTLTRVASLGGHPGQHPR